jgi:hypothetical protein
MLRRIWHRTAALALPVTLAICLPPLAVIAFNLHAQSAGPAREIALAHSATPKNTNRSGRPDRRAGHRVRSAVQQNQPGSSRE